MNSIAWIMIETNGFTLTSTTWLEGWAITCIMALIAIGVTNSDSFDDEAFGASIGAIFLSSLWPIILILAAVAIVVSIPILFGILIGKIITAFKEAKKEKMKNMSDIDKMLKTKKAD